MQFQNIFVIWLMTHRCCCFHGMNIMISKQQIFYVRANENVINKHVHFTTRLKTCRKTNFWQKFTITLTVFVNT